MKDLYETKLHQVRAPIERVIEIDDEKYIAHFIPLMRSEFIEIQKLPDADNQMIFASWVHPDGRKRLENAEMAGDFPVKSFNALVSAALEASGFGKKANAEAKKG